MSIDPPYRMDMFQTITNVHFGGLYLVVIVSGGNSSSNLFSASSSGAPTVSSGAEGDGVRLLDSGLVGSPGSGANNSSSGFNECFVYVDGADLRTAYKQFAGLLPPDFNDGNALWITEFTATNHSSCPWGGIGIVAPIGFFDFKNTTKGYLYSIPAGDKLVSITVKGIAAEQTSSTDIPSETTSGGSGAISAYVYSTVKRRVRRLSDLYDATGDGKPRPTEDDSCSLGITNGNQGRFLVNVKQDKDPANAQIDNYGKTFQPYKVTLDHGGATDNIPPQPPPRLPNA